MKKLLIFGGTFNPPHKGHIDLLKACENVINPDEIMVIPSNIPPHKEAHDLASSNDRVSMCRLAFSEFSNLTVSDIEIERKGKSFTVDTLAEIKEKYPQHKLYFVTGSDMYLTLEQWHRFEDIFKLAVILTSARNDEDYNKLISHQAHLSRHYDIESIVLEKPVVEVSSTEVREKIKFNLSADDLISGNVFDYIKTNNLYKG